MRRLALLLAALLLLGGCAALAEPEPPEEEWDGYRQLLPETPEEVPEEPGPEYPAAFPIPYQKDQSLDPVDGGGGQELAASLLYEPLFRLDGQFQPEGVLCADWEWDAAGLACTLTLREGVTFSDGSPLVARDVEDTLQRAMESARYGYRLRNVVSVAANRVGQVVITLSAPNRGFLALLDIPVVRRGTAGERVPAGTGPYLLEREGGEEFLRAREDWWQGKALPLETIPLVHAKDPDAAKYLFTTRRTELLAADPAADLALLSGRAEVAAQPTAVLQYLGFNAARDRPFSDPALRALASRCIDRKALAEVRLAGQALAAQFPISPLSPLYPAGLEQAYSEDAVPPAAGETVELTLLVTGGGFRAAAARFIADSLAPLGWRVEVAELPWEDYLAALETGEFDLYLGEVRLTADWDLTGLVGTGGALNYGGYSNETTDLALRSFLETEDREQAARRLCAHLQSTAPIAPLCFKNGAVLTRPGVAEGIDPAPGGVFYGFEGWEVHLS